MDTNLTLAATMETFDAPAFQASMASFFGVNASDITLTISPASIVVHLVVELSSAAEAYSAADQVQFNVSALASAAGVRVESVTIPSIGEVIYESWARPPPPPPSPSPNERTFSILPPDGKEGLTSAQLAVVSVCAVVLVVVLLACTVVARRRRAAAVAPERWLPSLMARQPLETLDLPAVPKAAGARAGVTLSERGWLSIVVVVVDVAPDSLLSPGVHTGDILVALNNVRVSSAVECSRAIQEADSVALRVHRKRSDRTAEAAGVTHKKHRLRSAAVAPEPLGRNMPKYAVIPPVQKSEGQPWLCGRHTRADVRASE